MNNKTSSDETLPSVAVLLCSHNGDKFIAEQLESIVLQDYRNLSLWLSDDGSTDNTLAVAKNMLDDSAMKYNIVSGPGQGFARNFLSLACDGRIESDYFAFADQDDVWADNKVSRAIKILSSVPAATPAMYCSRTTLVDTNCNKIGESPLFSNPASFSNALVQNIAGGNTIVFNKAAQDLLKAVGCSTNVVAHDWWLYLIVSGAGGVVHYDTEPTLFYRQHEDNLIASNHTLMARLQRIVMMFKGTLREWVGSNTALLLKNRALLSEANQRVLDDFCIARRSWLVPRLIRFRMARVYRQTRLSNLGLFVAAIFNKI
jgi:glycosyltransferase involved in cell wall biosynthesis